MWNDKLFNKALFFAMRAHDGQMMIFPSDISYCAHCVGVCMTAINHVKEKDVDWNLIVQVALLHDTIEDTGTTYDDICKEFGKEVADGVLALSKDSSLPYDEQLVDSIERIVKLKKEIAIVKLADRCYNINSKVSSWSKEKHEKYLEGARIICDRLGYASKSLRKVLLDRIKQY